MSEKFSSDEANDSVDNQTNTGTLESMKNTENNHPQFKETSIYKEDEKSETSDHSEHNSWDTDEEDEEGLTLSIGIIAVVVFVIILMLLIIVVNIKCCSDSQPDPKKNKINPPKQAKDKNHNQEALPTPQNVNNKTSPPKQIKDKKDNLEALHPPQYVKNNSNQHNQPLPHTSDSELDLAIQLSIENIDEGSTVEEDKNFLSEFYFTYERVAATGHCYYLSLEKYFQHSDVWQLRSLVAESLGKRYKKDNFKETWEVGHDGLKRFTWLEYMDSIKNTDAYAGRHDVQFHALAEELKITIYVWQRAENNKFESVGSYKPTNIRKLPVVINLWRNNHKNRNKHTNLLHYEPLFDVREEHIKYPLYDE